MAKITKEKSKKIDKKTKSNEVKESSLFDFDKEIIIGIPKTVQQDEPSKKKKKNKIKNKKEKNNKKIEEKIKEKNNKYDDFEIEEKKKKKNKKNKKNKKITKQQEIIIKRRKAVLRFFKWMILLAILIGAAVYFMASPMFNVKEITVKGNSELKEEEIISLSEIKIDENTFKINKRNAINNIKTKGYVENVKIKRNLPDKVEIIITERTPTYMLAFANSYAYINNQGYILKISSEKKNLPIIIGFGTPEDEIHEARRLCIEDLVKLEDILNIVESANANDLSSLITKIDISNREDYVFTIDEQKKIIHMGDMSDLSTKMLFIKKIIEEEYGKEGEIFVNTDLKNKGAIFREKV